MDRGIRLGKILSITMKYKYAILILAFGLIMMLLPSGGTKEKISEESAAVSESRFDLSAEEEKLCEMFSAMDGVGRVKVALTLKATSESVYALDESESLRDSGEGETESYEKSSDSRPMVLSGASGGESPLTVKEYYPEFKGALVVCDGADDPNIRLMITEAIRSLTGITSDNISVIKMKS